MARDDSPLKKARLNGGLSAVRAQHDRKE